MVHEIKNFEELEDILMQIPDERLVVLDCYAAWCNPCKKIGVVIEELSKKYKDVTFLKGNVEKIDKLVKEFNVTSMPTFIYFKNLKAVEKTTGANQREIENTIKQLR